MGRKGKLLPIVGVYPCEDEVLVSPGWAGPHILNLPPSCQFVSSKDSAI